MATRPGVQRLISRILLAAEANGTPVSLGQAGRLARAWADDNPDGHLEQLLHQLSTTTDFNPIDYHDPTGDLAVHRADLAHSI